MNKRFFILGTIVLNFAIFISGCGRTSDTMENVQTQTATTASTASPAIVSPPVITLPQEAEPLSMKYSVRWNELNKENVIEKEKNCVVEFVHYTAGDVWVFYAPGYTAEISFYDSGRNAFLSREVCAQQEVFLEFPPDCGFFSVSMNRKGFEEALLVKETGETLIVSQQEFSSRKTISQAVAQFADAGEILIFPGVYEEHVKAYGKEIVFWGIDREHCILESTSSDYYSPPMEISAGAVRNMTIRAVNRNSAPSQLYAYGVHADDNSMADHSLIFENCFISSDFNSGVGMGLRSGCNVEFLDCTIQGKENGLFCHDTPYQKYAGLQKLSMKNCVIEGKEGKQAILLDSQGLEGSRVELLFQKNVFQNTNNADGEGLLHIRNHNGEGTPENWMGLKNFWLSKESQKNSIEEFND